MVRAMGVGGVTGTFSLTCRTSMRILRKGKQPLMAMLEVRNANPFIPLTHHTHRRSYTTRSCTAS